MLIKLAKLIVSVHKNTHYGLKGLQRSKKAFGFVLKRSNVLANVRIDAFDCKCVRFVAAFLSLMLSRKFSFFALV